MNITELLVELDYHPNPLTTLAAAELRRQYAVIEALRGNVEAAIAFCPTCAQSVTSYPNMTRDEVIFHSGRAARNLECDVLQAENETLRVDGDIIINRLSTENNRLHMELDAARADAKRGRYMIDNGCWHRSEEQTHLAVLVPKGSDLSCYAMREAAIDAAFKGEPHEPA